MQMLFLIFSPPTLLSVSKQGKSASGAASNCFQCCRSPCAHWGCRRRHRGGRSGIFIFLGPRRRATLAHTHTHIHTHIHRHIHIHTQTKTYTETIIHTDTDTHNNWILADEDSADNQRWNSCVKISLALENGSLGPVYHCPHLKIATVVRQSRSPNQLCENLFGLGSWACLMCTHSHAILLRTF